MDIKGTIEALGLTRILEIISQNNQSGVLSVENPAEKGKFFFRFGILIHGSLSGTASQLGNILQTRGIVN